MWNIFKWFLNLFKPNVIVVEPDEDMKFKVSTHITYIEAMRSDIGQRLGLKNYFQPKHLVNMRILANEVFEPLRNNFGVPIFITSFFRTVEINKLTGGVYNSQHMAVNGSAIDLDAHLYGRLTNLQIFNYIKDNLEFDQLIAEWVEVGSEEPNWIHVSYNKGKNRNQILLMKFVKDKKVYHKYVEYKGLNIKEYN